MDKLNYIKSIIPQDFYSKLNKINDSSREHPLVEIIYAIEHPELTPMLQYYANYTVDSIINISKYYEEWFYKKWNKNIISSSKPELDVLHAIGALAEIRALNMLNDSNIKVETIKEKNGKNKDYTPDFRIMLDNENDAYIEVFCPLMKNEASEKLNEFNNKDHNLSIKNKVYVDMVDYNPVCEGVKGKDNIINKIGQRILGNKSKGNQAIEGSCNILLVDLISTEWGCMSKGSTLPYTSGKFIDFYNTTNFGIWQSLYGKKNMKLFDDRVYLKYADESNFKLQKTDGYFRQNNKWFGIIISFEDGVVFLQNPWATNYIKEDLIRKIIRLNNFDLLCSWIDTDHKNLKYKIENKINDIENIYSILSTGI